MWYNTLMKSINQSYIAIFDPAEEGGYNVSFPQFPGCVTYGQDKLEAHKMAKEALELWLEEVDPTKIKPIILETVSVNSQQTKPLQRA